MMDESAEPFQDVGRIFPGEVHVTSVEPGRSVRDALALMMENRYSQLPVISDGRVRGVFSLWSLSQHLLELPNVSPHQLAVEDVMEILPSVTVEDSLDLVLENLNRHDAILVESPRGLQAVATATDVLNYFYRVAKPFVLLQEIELSLRALLSICLSDDELRACLQHALSRKYDGEKRPLPSKLEDLTFDDYRAVIAAKENWPLFEGTLGRNRDLAASKLARVGSIRNMVFHFRGQISVLDHETLAATRNWLLDKSRAIQHKPTQESP